jgi:hypothetical protein
MADYGLLFETNSSCEQKAEAIKVQLDTAFEHYPHEVSAIMSDSLEILHVSRHNQNNKEFRCHMLRWTRGRIYWQKESVPCLGESGLL